MRPKMMLLLGVVLAGCLSAGAQVQGPIYTLMEEYRQALADGQADPSAWAQRISDALEQNPDEEWSTRIRAYEELGSLYWRADQFEDAAPIFLELWQEAEARGDSDASVSSLDNLINLYADAKFPAEDQMALYDATEGWLRDPPPGKEELYAKLLLELYSERSSRAKNFAHEAIEGSAEQRAFAEQAEYFAGLAAQTQAPGPTPTVTLAKIAAIWFAKENARNAERDHEAVPEEQTEATMPSGATPPPPKSKVEFPPAPIVETSAPPASATPQKVLPPETGISTELVVLGCVVVIVTGWGLAAFLYLRRRG